MNRPAESTQGYRAAHSAWHIQLDGSAEVDQVLAITRDYLATFSPEHLARLPESCRPGRIKGEDDIAYWSCRLAQYNHATDGGPVDGELMQEILNYFLHAWVRISQLHRARAAQAPERTREAIH